MRSFSRNHKRLKTFYIAHRIIDRREVKRLCKRLQEAGMITVNPFYLPNGTVRPERPEIKKIDDGKMDPYFIKGKVKALQIVEADLGHIDKSDATLAFIRQASIGTSMEIFYTKWVLHKPVYVITEKYHKHAWIVTFTDKIFKNADQFIRWYVKHHKKK